MKNRVYASGTGIELTGTGIRSIQSVIEEMITGAREEIIIATYTMSGNIQDLFDFLEKSASRGVRITIILNRICEQPREIRRLLAEFTKKYIQVRVYDFHEEYRDLHMKVVVADRQRALVGSANLTWKGMVDNLEMGVVIEGEVAEKIANVLRTLISCPGFRIFSGEC